MNMDRTGGVIHQNQQISSRILENLRKKWENPKYNDGTCILSKGIGKEIKKLMVYVEKGCLSDIPASCSTSKNERLHKDMNNFIRSSRLGVELAYSRIFRTLYLHTKKKDLAATTMYKRCTSMAEEEYKRSILANSHLQEDTNLLESGPVNCGVFGIRPKVKQSKDEKGPIPYDVRK
jgi:hypothetical protein